MPIANRVDSDGALSKVPEPVTIASRFASAFTACGPRIAPSYGNKSQQAFPPIVDLQDRWSHSRPHSGAEAEKEETTMLRLETSLTRWQSLALAGIVAGSIAAGSSAIAGECPAGKMKPDVREKVDFKPQGVTDITLGSIDLEKQPAHLKGRELRFRKLTIEPGGIVPWHSHDDRPALIFVQQGEIVEYASNCSEPIVHKAGDIRPEVFGTSHWWKNLGKETVILYVGDVRRDPQDHNM
jgi:quercetin dioxygenase-like cupin family protein